MNRNVLNQAGKILADVVDAKDPYEKVAIILKVIPIESFDEAFRFFDALEQRDILDAMEVKISVNSVETLMVVSEFVKKADLHRFLKTSTASSEETFSAFQKFAGKNPRRISSLLKAIWLDE
jgi:hypothetical protein